MTVRAGELTIAAPLVAALRSSLKRELSGKLEMLQILLDAHLTPDDWEEALESFNEGCDLLAVVGLTDDPAQADIEVELDRWGALVLGCLEEEYQDGLQRIRDADAGRFDSSLIGQNVPALGELVKEIEQRTRIQARRSRPMSFLEKQLANRRIGRRRGDRR
jgi:hypothetical protein